ncbi:UvrD-helicase domain-containing protein [Candidatus Gracilibacteria bacterium]|nr:UvrD-helicase domain-containing protein [Candidatus Gracilibacteria bacterium]
MQHNEKQLEAITHKDGPLLIIAGAGSGKTATLTARIGHMISEDGVEPSSILALTFTNKAAGEMKERTAQVIGAQYRPSMMQNRHLPYIGTFHSFGIFVLKEVLSGGFQDIDIGLKKDFLIYDESDKLSVLRSIIKDELGLIEKEFPARQVAYHISDAKNRGLNAKSFESEVDSQIKEVAHSAFVRYEKRLQGNNAIDFDDILAKTLTLFQNIQILEYYQSRYKYIMVDEYQDTNLVQYEIVSLLAGKYKNLAVVGDDWQSIYSWRGADMRNILHFQKDYPNAKVVKLEQNYRSTQNIIKAANIVIAKNTEALKKELWTDNFEGEKIQYFEAVDDNSEANFIAENIEEYMNIPILNPFPSEEKGAAASSLSSQERVRERCYSDNLILYRTNAQSRKLEEAFLKKGIPYKVIGGLKFYERKEIKDMLSYLRLIHNPEDSVAFLRIINTPSRKIGAKTLEVLTNIKNNFGLSYIEVLEDISDIDEVRPQAREALANFYTMFQLLMQASSKVGLQDLLANIISDTNYEAYLKREYSSDEYESKKENLEELRNVASEYEGIDPRESLSLFLEEVALITDLEQKLEDEEVQRNPLGYVTLMTIHTSKGLEQKRVFVTGLEEGLFPSKRTISEPRQLEEERRLMYVAMTRACDELFLTRARERFYFGEYVRNPESRFIKEIPEEYMEKVESQMSNFSFGSMSSMFSDIERGTPAIRKPKTENNLSDFRTGMRVEHHRFGIGIIENLLGENAEIRFKEGMKKMNIRIAPIKILSE